MKTIRRKTNQKDYSRVTPFYDKLTRWYSQGVIQDLKEAQISEIKKGDRVLYVGVGNAEDAVLAAKKGAEVTCIDISSKMLENAKRRFQEANLKGKFICVDIMKHKKIAHYDVVVANFFLNIFPEKTMKLVLEYITSLSRKGGKLMIADFAPPQGSSGRKYLHLIYYWYANFSFWLIGLAPLHKVYNYSIYFASYGLGLKKIKEFPLKLLKLPVYKNIIAIHL